MRGGCVKECRAVRSRGFSAIEMVVTVAGMMLGLLFLGAFMD